MMRRGGVYVQYDDQLLSMGALLFATSRGTHLPFLAASEIALYNGYYTSSAGYKE